MAQRTFTIKAAARRARHTAEPPSPPQPGPEEAAATEHRDASGTCFLMVTPDVNCALHVLSDFLSTFARWSQETKQAELTALELAMLRPILLLWNV
ncbi:hypothetical protein MAA_08051 [Metarhizium robertsii ARSEF 23]|uniref:Uncharacterized protein n=1 Tax=Metarhizium robertsii (strain ARSEF 23 / ATCC MYA-3075) TaxID=655844 RepID=E9F702_METRA|nr:uncharacterized protein MAA_08051 [Metarhizium robertsii ARSEF 23]EFY96554.1 hypothetical protein MAA_08051 [Metarhizium robertsii ARSEF 23]